MGIKSAKWDAIHLWGRAVQFRGATGSGQSHIPRASHSPLSPESSARPWCCVFSFSGRRFGPQWSDEHFWFMAVRRSSCGHMACGKGWSVFPFPSAFLHFGVSPAPPGEAEAQGDCSVSARRSRRARIQRNTGAFYWKVPPGPLWEAVGAQGTRKDHSPAQLTSPREEEVQASPARRRGCRRGAPCSAFHGRPLHAAVAHRPAGTCSPRPLSPSPRPSLSPPLLLQLPSSHLGPSLLLFLCRRPWWLRPPLRSDHMPLS